MPFLSVSNNQPCKAINYFCSAVAKIQIIMRTKKYDLFIYRSILYKYKIQFLIKTLLLKSYVGFDKIYYVL